MGGQIQVNLAPADPFRSFVKASSERWPSPARRAAPTTQVPTMIEWVPISLSSTVVILTPARTPANIDRLNSEVNESRKSSELATNLLKAVYEPKVESPQNVAAFLADEIQKWLPIARETGFSID